MLKSAKLRFILCCLVLVISMSVDVTVSKKFEAGKKPAWAKKNIMDYTDADIDRLYDQWEEDEEPLPSDELPEHLRPRDPQKPHKIQFDKMNTLTPEQVMKMSKKDKSVIMFVDLDGSPTRNECEKLTSLWQLSLRNNHLQADRFVVGDNRAIFLFEDGAQAWDAKEYLLDQVGLMSISLEGQSYNGRRARNEEL